jgi:hypothetical protein
MPPLDNPRWEHFAQGHEAFVQAYSSPMAATARRQYRTTYPKCKTARSAEVNGSRLLRNAEVSARIAELQSQGAERAVVTLDGQPRSRQAWPWR